MFIRFIAYSSLAVLAVVLLTRLVVWGLGQNHIYSADEVPAGRVAIVFGAGLRRDGTPTAVLRDRVATAAQLYFQGRVEKLLMSGDNRVASYNESQAMADYAIALGVPAEDIVLDYAGRRTYDTCYRAGAIFGLDQAILVTQQFHLPRALFLCNAFGLQASGVPAEGSNFRRSSLVIWSVRELAATFTAVWDVYFSRPLPVLGEPEPIFPERS